MSKKNNFIPPKKQQKQDTKKPIFWVLFFLIIFWTVSGILGVCSFIGLSPSSDNTLIVKADTVTDEYVYVGNNYFVPTSSYYNFNPQYPVSPYFLSCDTTISRYNYNSNINLSNTILNYRGHLFRFEYYMDNVDFALTAYAYDPLSDDIGHTGLVVNDYSQLDYPYFDICTIPFDPSITDSTSITDDTDMFAQFYLVMYNSNVSGYAGQYGLVNILHKHGFNNNIVSIRYNSITTPYNTNANKVVNTVTYYDNNNYELTISYTSIFSSSAVRTGRVAWEDRLYYISNNFTNNEFFQNGLIQGYEQGKKDYLNSGFQDGFDKGFEAGEDKGYNEGVLDANNYSFLGLMTAVIDAPIQALTGLFGFELLGVNLMSVISGLFTVCVILVLLRLLLGGGLSG